MFDGWDLVSETSKRAPTFQLVHIGGRRFAVDSQAVIATADPLATTHVPGTPAWVRGVVLWEGQVVPVLSAAKRLGLVALTATTPSQLLELKVRGEPFFIEIESLGEVIAAVNFEACDERLLLGFVALADEMIPILDLAAVTDISDEGVSQ